ncbi:helix-turn-helix domain-containing protein [Oscillochloris sp. ZM17-4]|uniref:helix-turn-helix domain-containing protein n=1 Tax=Oscillochloris sp. ZM17-4 TaxID=2866714 RepID=UPI001C731BF8|nr:helix-turn-helix transcriptional regulator [Oscillochloris sp. ZM17-4]MBX0329912.1 helix-turn-helix domain-containing protein [Oscillochloris sp. ZM17-4]
MTPLPAGDTPSPEQEPERPEDSEFRRLIINGGRWWLEFFLRLRPGELPGRAALSELYDQDGPIHHEQIAHLRLHMPAGVIHEIDDPDTRAAFLAQIQALVAQPDPLLRAQDRNTAELNAFPDGQGNIPTNPAVFTTISAIWKGGQRARELIDGWGIRSDGMPFYQHTSVHGGIISVYVQPGRGSLATGDTLWALVERLSPFTADVALAVLAQLCAPESGSGPQYPLLEPIRITADTILSYKGIQRWGSDRADMRQRIAEEIDHLRHLSFDVEAWPVGDGDQPLDHASWRGDTLFDIVIVERSGESQAANISWSVRAGQWAYWWLNASGRIFVGRMARALLELDHRENRGVAVLAKKIGQHILMRAGSNQRSQITIGVAALLTDIGELPKVAARTKDWAGRTRDRLDSALLSLREADIFVDVTWPDGYGPTDEDRQRGWVDRWLAARIDLALTTPTSQEQIMSHASAQILLQASEVILDPPPTEETLISGASIRRARAARHWKQDQLARHLSISVPYLSQIEGDRRQPSPQLAARLRAWLAEPMADTTGSP